MVSIVMVAFLLYSLSTGCLSGRLQRLLARLPVARAELVGLQRIEHAQHLLRIAADAEVIHRGEADDALRVDDEGRAQRHPLALVEDAERSRQLALDVGEPRESDLAEIVTALPPREVDELA